MLRSVAWGTAASRGARLALLAPVLVYLVMIALFIKDSNSAFGLPLDDGWIHRVYSRSFASGHGFAYNDGEQEAGSTSPLWVVVSAPAHWFGAAGAKTVIALVKVISIILGLVFLGCAGYIGREVTGSTVAGCVAAVLLALEPRFLFSSLSGMEINLLIAIWAGGAAALLAGRLLLSVLLFSLAPVARPEAIVILPFAAIGLAGLTRRRALSPATLLLWLIPLLPLLAWGFFCKSVNGHFLPNTYYLKSRPFHFGRAEVSLAWSSICDGGLVPWWAYLVGLAAFVATCVKRMDQRKWITLGVFVAAPVIYLVAVFGTRQILLQGYYWTRWLDPALLALAVPASVGYGALIRWAGASRRLLGKETGPGTSLTLVTAVIGVIGIGCLAASIPPYAHSFSDRRSHLASDARAIDLLNVRAGKWINEHTPHDATIVVTDAGGTRYFGMRRTIDLVGLNNAAIAFHRLDARDAIRNADWLAICPALFSGSDLQRYIAAEFTPRIEIRIPPAEYTICNNPWQAVIEILERNPKPAMPGSR